MTKKKNHAVLVAATFLAACGPVYTTDLALYDKAEFWALPDQLLIEAGGDCEDWAIFNVLQSRAQGHMARLVIGDHVLDQSGHAWAEAMIDGQLVYFDLGNTNNLPYWHRPLSVSDTVAIIKKNLGPEWINLAFWSTELDAEWLWLAEVQV